MFDRKYLVLVCALLLSACEDKAKKITFDALPEELADCKIFSLEFGLGGTLNVMRCPLSTTTTQTTSGKQKVYTAVVERGN